MSQLRFPVREVPSRATLLWLPRKKPFGHFQAKWNRLVAQFMLTFPEPKMRLRTTSDMVDGAIHVAAGTDSSDRATSGSENEIKQSLRAYPINTGKREPL